MKIIRKSTITFISIMLISNLLFAQELVNVNKREFNIGKQGHKEAMSNIKKGDELYNKQQVGLYRVALEHYLKAYSYNKNNAELNYKIGASYLFSTEKSKAKSFLEAAQLSKPTIAKDIDYLLAKAYKYNYEFDKAIDTYNKFLKSNYPFDEKKHLSTNKIKKEINECEHAKKLTANPVRAFIDPISGTINSKYPDYCPVISADESTMIFTSRREGEKNKELDPNDMLYYEDLYISHSSDKINWSEAVSMKSINTELHDASVGLSPDGQTLYTYKGTPNGTLFESKLKGDVWSKPKKMNKHINSKFHETSASISYDGKKLYFVSTRTKDSEGTVSFGGKDIYVSELNEDGEWGPAKNVGAPINSEYDEEAVFMHPDGVTMYFSSKRVGSMGGYDIFYSEMDANGKWSEPVNMGHPINTPEDDTYFVISANGRNGYYSSSRAGGIGLQDIYKITLLGPEKLLVPGLDEILIASSNTKILQQVKQEEVEVKKVRLAIMKGTVKDALSQEPIEASIEITDNDKGEIISNSTSNSKTGNYLVSLPSGKNYGVTVRAEGYLFYSENIEIPEFSQYQEITKDIVLSKVGIGSRIVLKNIFFDFGKATLRPVSYPELNRLLALLNSYPEMKIEIGGHTDNKGSLKINTKVSEDRAKSVVDYLVQNGISKSRLSFKGYAYTEPIASNDTEAGRQENRRVEFKVISIK